MPVADTSALLETLCVQEQRVVGRDNTVSFEGLKLQLPESPLRHHFVKARVRVHRYPDGALAVFHGPRCLARYDAAGAALAAPAAAAVPTRPSMTPCSAPSRRGLSGPAFASPTERRPALTAPARGVIAPAQVGTKKRSCGRTKKLTGSKIKTAARR